MEYNTNTPIPPTKEENFNSKQSSNNKHLSITWSENFQSITPIHLNSKAKEYPFTGKGTTCHQTPLQIQLAKTRSQQRKLTAFQTFFLVDKSSRIGRNPIITTSQRANDMLGL